MKDKLSLINKDFYKSICKHYGYKKPMIDECLRLLNGDSASLYRLLFVFDNFDVDLLTLCRQVNNNLQK